MHPQSPDPGYPQQSSPSVVATSGIATASMIFGILGVTGGCCMFGLPAVFAIIFGHIGLKQTAGGVREGRGMATAGVVLGYVGAAPAIMISVWIFFLGGLGLVGSVDGTAEPSGSPSPSVAVVGRAAQSAVQPSSRPGSPSSVGAPVDQIELYTLPANSSGQRGQQRDAYDVTLAGQRYPKSTGVWVRCVGGTQTRVSFYVGGRYQRLSAIAGLADAAPAGLTAQLTVFADDTVWKAFPLNRDQSTAIDLEIGRFQTIEFVASTPQSCPASARPLAYLGDAVVF